jgi:hypothetical protein
LISIDGAINNFSHREEEEKKRRKEKREGASISTAASGVHAPKQRKRRVQRESPQAPGARTLFPLI